ncbi:MAG: glycosyltransferase family 4 protein [Candidatus Bathyarchaeia archaeon]|jgi:glycosyltransferase involved in cell wall biosynthesis
MNICVVNTFFPPHVSGTARAAYLLARKLSETGHKLTVITSSIGGPPSTEKLDGMTVYRLRSVRYPKLEILHKADLYSNLMPGNFWHVARILMREKVEVVQMFGQFFDLTFLCVLAAKIMRLPIVLTIGTRMEHTQFMYDTFFRLVDKTLIKQLVARRVNKLIAMDKLMHDYMKDRYNPSDHAIKFIPVGVDLERFQNVSGDAIRRQFGLGPEDPAVLSLGTMSNLRTANGLLNALPSVLQEFPAVRLLVVGPLYDNSPLELVRKLELEKSVIFCGRVDYAMIPSYIGASDVEGHDLDTGLGIGLASLEAMAAGKAVLSSAKEDNFMNLRLKNWENIALVRPGNAQDISNALVKLLSDRKLREQIGRNAQAYIRSNFSLEAACRKYEAVYEELTK